MTNFGFEMNVVQFASVFSSVEYCFCECSVKILEKIGVDLQTLNCAVYFQSDLITKLNILS